MYEKIVEYHSTRGRYVTGAVFSTSNSMCFRDSTGGSMLVVREKVGTDFREVVVNKLADCNKQYFGGQGTTQGNSSRN